MSSVSVRRNRKLAHYSLSNLPISEAAERWAVPPLLPPLITAVITHLAMDLAIMEVSFCFVCVF